MRTIFKLVFLCICFVTAKCIAEDEVLKCNLRYCGAELLNFENFAFRNLFRKMEIASFCIKNCTPPVLREFFQGIIYGITKRIPGLCYGEQCIDENRFVALAKCVEEQAWPLLQCSKRLIDLAHIGLVAGPEELKRNTTCNIVTEAVQCIEESLQVCGEGPFSLVKEILGDLIRIGITAYCHPSYRDENMFKFILTKAQTTVAPGISPENEAYVHPKYVKGYRRGGNGAYGFPTLSHFCLLCSVLFSVLLSVQRTQ